MLLGDRRSDWLRRCVWLHSPCATANRHSAPTSGGCAAAWTRQAIRATAHKLARLVYAILTKGSEYVDCDQTYYEERYRERVVPHLNKKALAMGFKLTPI